MYGTGKTLGAWGLPWQRSCRSNIHARSVSGRLQADQAQRQQALQSKMVWRVREVAFPDWNVMPTETPGQPTQCIITIHASPATVDVLG